MRRLLIAALLIAAPLSVASQEPPPEASLGKAYWVECASYMERASQKAMFDQNPREDVEKALACGSPEAFETLPTPQMVLFTDAQKMYLASLRAPSATAHTSLLTELQKFLRSFD